MRHLYFLQQWYGLALEDAVYDSQAMRTFFGDQPALRRSARCDNVVEVSHLLEEHDLCATIFAKINAHLEGQGLWCARALWWTPRLSMPPHRRKIKTAPTIRKCIRPRREASGILA